MRRFLLALTFLIGIVGSAAAQNCFPNVSCRVSPIPDTQTVVAGATINVSDACGGLKRVTAAGAVSTSTTNTFTAPATENASCVVAVCNIGTVNTITLKNNANFFSTGAVDIALTANDCVLIGSTGATGAWFQVAPISNN